jgi:ABC-2 type transport system ATP-binding protein
LEEIALEIKDLRKFFDENGEKLWAVDGISLSVKKGEIFSFLGPNGAGKTTTIRMASTSLDPSSGTAKIFGKDIVKERSEVRKKIGICPQDLVFYENLTVLENLMFFGKMHGKTKKELKEYALFLIKMVGLEEKTKSLALNLSGGMKRRLNLIIALVNDPDLIFLDEPTAGLDPQTRRLIWEFLKELKERGKTLFLTTHYMDEADYLSDNVAIIDRGQIIANDSPFDLKQEYSGGDIVEFKFKEADEIVLKKLEDLKGDSHFKELKYIEEDNLFRVDIHNGLHNISDIMTPLKDLGLNIAAMNVQSNSLENVFINLTGRSLRE